MSRFHPLLCRYAAVLLVAFVALAASSQTQLPSEIRDKIDKLANETLVKTGTPAVSLVVVKDGQIAYLKAYGNANLDPQISARSDMRYCLGALSKPFTAEAMLFLQEQGKLSLDDKVSKFFPDLTRSNEVTIRQLLSHTSGYQEFWPLDYVPQRMLEPTAPRKILDKWAHKPLNFDPGTKWEISDTNYVIAGMIVEKVSGMTVYQLLKQTLFTPLSMESVADINSEELDQTYPTGYMRYGIGPVRTAPHEAPGWLFGGEHLAMTAEDLGKWDISIIDQKLLKPASYRQFESNMLLANGMGTGFALGNGITRRSERRMLYSIGDLSGFSAENTIFPDERIAIAVLSNMDAGAPGEITNGIIPLLLSKKPDPDAPQKLELARKIFDSLQHGSVDRSLFTDDANSYFNDAALKDFAASLAPLGAPQEFVQTAQSFSNGLVSRSYRIKFSSHTLAAHMLEEQTGKLEQYVIELE